LDFLSFDALERRAGGLERGDLHIENFGGYLGKDGLLYFDIVDFDKAVLAPCTFDVVHLATSALIAGKWRRRLIDYAEDYRDIACGPATIDDEGVSGRRSR
jgi:uncharacterized protein (DUF2252 family)